MSVLEDVSAESARPSRELQISARTFWNMMVRLEEEGQTQTVRFTTKTAARVMVFSAVASDGSITQSHFIKGGLLINTSVYLDILDHVLLPWMNCNWPRQCYAGSRLSSMS